MNIETSTWFRESTQEWVIEMVVRIPDQLFSTTRYTGKTQLEALKYFQENYDKAMERVKLIESDHEELMNML
jgi:hypothetical protein